MLKVALRPTKLLMQPVCHVAVQLQSQAFRLTKIIDGHTPVWLPLAEGSILRRFSLAACRQQCCQLPTFLSAGTIFVQKNKHAARLANGLDPASIHLLALWAVKCCHTLAFSLGEVDALGMIPAMTHSTLSEAAFRHAVP